MQTLHGLGGKTRSLLLNLAASLEWDAANDATFLARLQQDFQKASASLYDWSNGQVALGMSTIYQARERWDEADIRTTLPTRCALRPTVVALCPIRWCSPACN